MMVWGEVGDAGYFVRTPLLVLSLLELELNTAASLGSYCPGTPDGRFQFKKKYILVVLNPKRKNVTISLFLMTF